MIIIQTVAIVIKPLAGLCAFRLHYLKYVFQLIRRVEEKYRTNLNYHWPVIFVFIFSFLSFTFFSSLFRNSEFNMPDISFSFEVFPFYIQYNNIL